MQTINITRATVNPYYELPPTTKVGGLFRENRQNFLAVTDAQATAFEKVVARQGREAYVECHYDHLDECLVVKFKHIFIGIERDGYAHS